MLHHRFKKVDLAQLALPKLKLGSQEMTFPFVLAPMAGITNAPFRMLMREMGAGRSD